MNKEEQFLSELLEVVDKPELNTKDIKSFIKYIFKLSTLYYHINNLTYSFCKLQDNQGGSFSSKTNKVELNKKFLTQPNNLASIAVTIFHETRHYYQNQNYKFKIDSKIIPQMPVFYCPNTIFLIDEKSTSFNPFDIYYTSFLEKDARDYALKNAKKVFNYLYENSKNITAKQSFLIFIDALNQRDQKEQNYYRDSMFRLTYNKQTIKEKVTKEINKAIRKFNDNPTYNFSQMIRAFCGNIIIYCDEDIKNKIKLAFKPYIHSPKILPYYAVLFNYLLWNTSTKDLNELFEIVHNNNIDFNSVLDVLTCFDKDDLEKRYKNYIKNIDRQKTSSSQRNTQDDCLCK